MRRYNILNGDTTNARGGGTVIGSATYFINYGRALALIGDDVICRECGKVGKIYPNGPRLRESVHGRDVALNGDLCLCDCEPPPQLIHSRTDMYQEIDTDEVIRQGFGSWVGVTPSYDDQFQVVDQLGRPVRNKAYRIVSSSGVVTKGITDAQGKTSRVVTDGAENLHLYL